MTIPLPEPYWPGSGCATAAAGVRGVPRASKSGVFRRFPVGRRGPSVEHIGEASRGRPDEKGHQMATVEVPESSGRKDMADTDGGLTPAAEEVARGRRKLLTGGLAAGAAALGAWSLTSAQPASADSGDNLIVGEINTAGALTALDMTADPYSLAAFAVNTNGQGTAILGSNHSSGPGV